MNSAEYEYAGLWRRTAALLIDVFLAASLLACVVLGWGVWTGDLPAWGSRTFTGLLAGGTLLALLAMVVLDARLQGTPGLQLLDCRLVDARNGQAIGLGHSARRAFFLLAAILPLLLGLLWIGWDRRKQGLHDKLAGTLVIREDYARWSLEELARGSQ